MKPCRYWLLLAVAGSFSLFAHRTGAQEARAYLVLATNESEASSPELREFEPSLKKIFGYKFYETIATDAAALREKQPVTLKLDRGMTLTVTAVGVERNARLLDVVIKQGQTTLMTSQMRMSGGAPLFIRAHERSDGLLLIILVVR
jgi:hypothetical protein